MKRAAIYSESLPAPVAGLSARIAYFRALGSDYFEGPLPLDELEALVRWAEVSLPKRLGGGT